VITVENLERTFGSLRAVDDLSFHLEPGEVVGFLGVNGAGKTTTMRILAGYLPATSGRVEVAGFDVLHQSLEVRKRIGYLPESVPLYREHRVREMLQFQARLHGLPRSEARRRIGEVVERVGLSDRVEHLIGGLSKGLRQRVGIAVALLPSPEVLILDEPTSGLDPLQRLEVRKLIAELADEHTVLLSSHILSEVEATCPRVLIVHKGRKAADGTPEELVRELGGASYVQVDAVVGDPAEAQRILAGFPDALEVQDLGRLGVHHQFRVLTDSDLREEVGAVAAARGWALRELSWQRPTLEQLFAQIALELDGPDRAAGTGPAAAPAPAAEPASALAMAPSASPPGASTGAPRKVYNLNPFDMGSARDLGRPKAVEPGAGGDADAGDRASRGDGADPTGASGE